MTCIVIAVVLIVAALQHFKITPGKITLGNSRGTGPEIVAPSGHWYDLVCIDGVQYISSYRRLAVRVQQDGTPYTCTVSDVTFDTSDYPEFR